MQVEPAVQVVQPVQPMPPHCPHFGAAQALGPAAEEVALVDVAMVVGGGAAVVLDFTGMVEVALAVELGADPVDPPAAAPHPTRLELMAMSSYQKVLASPPSKGVSLHICRRADLLTGLPAKVNARDLGFVCSAGPTVGVGVGDAWANSEARNSIAVQPSLNGAVRTEMVL